MNYRLAGGANYLGKSRSASGTQLLAGDEPTVNGRPSQPPPEQTPLSRLPFVMVDMY